jgi:hypothetical protein
MENVLFLPLMKSEVGEYKNYKTENQKESRSRDMCSYLVENVGGKLKVAE